jgi:hypothetical protein
MVRTIFAIAVASPLFAQYGGPAILARGEAPAAMSTSQIDFRPFVSIGGSYDVGLNGVSVSSTGKLNNPSSEGLQLSGGVSGLHSWKHTKIGLNYSANFSHYSQASYYDGVTQNLLLGITHQLARHVTFNLNNSASLSGSNLTSPSLPSTIQYDPNVTNVPTNQFFDNRTFTMNSQASLTIQRSTRLSLSFGGEDFVTRYRSKALFGVTGIGAHGDLQYRLNRRSTIGARYSFEHFNFSGILSNTDAHSVVATYSARVSRSLEVSGLGGVSRFETEFLQDVPIDPVVAALIGISSAQAVFYHVNWIPNLGARVTQAVRKGTLFATGSYSLNPGNGLFLTSKATSVSAGYNFTGLRRWAISAGGSYNNASSVGNVTGKYGSYSADLSASRQIASYTHAVLGFNARKYDSGDFKNYNTWSYGVRLSVAFSPGNIPLRLW